MDLQTQIQSQQNSLIISLKFPKKYSNLSYNFEMIITIYQQSIPSFALTQVYQKKFVCIQSIVKINNLAYSKNFKVNIKFKGGSITDFLEKNIFASTSSAKHQNSLSQLSQQQQVYQPYSRYNHKETYSRKLSSQNNYQLTNQQSFDKKSNFQKNKTNFSNSQIMMKMIGQTSSFINKNKVNKYIMSGRKCRNINQFINQKQRITNTRQVMQKKMLLAQGINIFNEVYSKKDGLKFFKNDWFMGPFYSYDLNQDQLKK